MPTTANPREEPSVAGSPLGPRRPSKPRSRRAASSKPVPAPLPAHGSAVLHTPPQSQQQEGSESESELDSPISPPRLIFVTQPEEPGTPTSPGGGSPSIDMKPAMSPKGSTFGSDTEEWHSLDSDDDPYFNSLVENFVIAAQDVRKSTLPDDNIDKKGDHQRKSDLYAESALNHYNNDKKNKIKYELISAITSWEIMDEKGCYSHVNFRAKGNQENSKEELFFAELRWDCEAIVPTCVLSLKGQSKVGGLCDTVYGKLYAVGVPIDSQHCYACLPGLKHPKNGELYETGHVAMSVYYNG